MQPLRSSTYVIPFTSKQYRSQFQSKTVLMWDELHGKFRADRTQRCHIQKQKQNIKRKLNLCCDRPWRHTGLWDVEAPSSPEKKGSQKGTKLWALRAGHTLPPRWFLALICIRGWEDAQGNRTRLTEKSTDPIRNRARDLPACRIVTEPTSLPRAPTKPTKHGIITINKTPWLLVRKRTMPTERPPLVDEI
jgi:hypothetical protein